MSTSDPVLYPAPHDTLEGMRQDVQRTRAELAHTLEALAERVSPRRVTRPAILAPAIGAVAVGVAVFVVLRRIPLLRAIAAIGAAGATVVAARRVGHQDAPAPAQADREDVVSILIDQHRRIERAFVEALAATGADRLDDFAVLAELLQHHERIEQEFVHPLLHSIADDVTDARRAEEESANRALASLISRGVDHPEFERGLERLRDMVRRHAAHEESYEFPLLRQHVDPRRLRRLAGEVRWLG